MGNYSKDRIYFTWIPRKTDENGYKWLTWLRDVLYSNNGKDYQVIIRQPYQYVKWWIFRTA